MSFRANPTDRALINNAIVEKVTQQGGVPVPTQTDVIRAALWHFWSASTPEQRATAFEIGLAEIEDIKRGDRA